MDWSSLFSSPIFAGWSGAGQAMPESYGANSPIMDPLAKTFISGITLPQRTVNAAKTFTDSGIYDPAPFVESAMLPMGTGAVAGVPMRAGEAVLGAGPIRAYHGSPHDFDRFSLDKIGTGEGAQAYGHGLYFAEKEAIAKSYRDALSPPKFGDQLGNAYDLVKQLGEDGALKAVQDALPRNPQLQVELDAIKSGAYKDWKPQGHMYEVGINADPEHFLDWEAKLGEQPKAVQGHFAKQLEQFGPNARMDAQLKIAGSRHPQGLQGVTQDLAQAGIPGIKYLDQGSRAAGDGSRNYVVFDDKLIDIMKKYAIPGMLGSPIFARAMQKNDQ